MTSLAPIISLSILLAIALAGGMIAHRLRQPIVIGYILIGILAGPHALGWVKDSATVEMAASFGVALLMFTVGLETSFTQLRDVGRVGLWGGLLQIILTIILGTLSALFIFRWSLQQSIIFGLIISLSSTAICLKILMDRGELSSVHGRIMIAMLILQDLSVVIMMVALPLMGNAGAGNIAMELALALGKALLFIGVSVVLGQWVLPWLLGDVGGVRSRELFLLTVLVLCLGSMIGTYLMGLSMVFGAFLIGLILRSTRFVHQALAEITPLRDIFATLFFVSIGMMLDPGLLLINWQEILYVVIAIIIIKIAVVFSIVKAFGYTNRVAIYSSAGIFQIGEFGFVLAQGALEQGIFTPALNSVILPSIVITMILTPFIIGAVDLLYPAVTSITGKKARETASCTVQDSPQAKQGHIIIAGYGRVGQNLASGLDNAGIPYLVIDIDPDCVSGAKTCRLPNIYGDASIIQVLSQADLCNAAALVVTFPDPRSVEATVRNALSINPDLKILARFQRQHEAQKLTKLGVIELVNPEVEAGFKFFKLVLKITGMEKEQRTALVDAVRRSIE